MIENWRKETRANDVVILEHEIDRYITDPIEDAVDEFDVLKWWKLNGVKYPGLALIAKDVLAIPVSTVASESCFSTSGRVVNSFRAFFTPKIVEAIICSQNWLRSDDISSLQYEPTIQETEFYESIELGMSLYYEFIHTYQTSLPTEKDPNTNKIGEGGFGSVYKGLLSDGTVIAVKQLSSKSKQGNREFVNEIGMISALQHPHLVKLHGCCIEGNQLLLVYEYMENNSLARALFGPEESRLKLDWPTRHKICVGIARGLAYLHEESRLKVVHRDIKATNVLLDKNLTPKISDFGLAKLDEEDNTHISTRIAGTYGYMAPEYAMRGYLTDKADAYSFGIRVLEIASGRNNTTCRGKEKSFYLLDLAQLLKGQGNLLDLVDPRLRSDFNKEEMMLTINVALLCCNVTSTVRPTMSSVVSMLEGRAAVQELVSDPNASSNEIEAMRKHFQSSFGRNTGESQTQTASTEGPWTGSSTSAHDLYPVKPDSTYWDNRK
ncbi:probable leucine-rich repeat receptor-like serine/threonine-protein kinase At3g14840 [Prunus avium]|uniref:Probable leucine-rich repeat receptor-like serine/threonine-protein kinase At3g14840 n=1 Tax=Prunus avium TaxID=42229 RepID=A0A6P5U571_PRUAV|nr:probable leucine-rich repeat receptor-like serine/threonine-protein kinase At3g14840 [Prunus avium]